MNWVVNPSRNGAQCDDAARIRRHRRQRVGKTQSFLAEAVKAVGLQAAGRYSAIRRQQPRGRTPPSSPLAENYARRTAIGTHCRRLVLQETALAPMTAQALFHISSAALIEPMKLLQVRRAHGQDEYVFKYRLPVGFARATAVA